MPYRYASIGGLGYTGPARMPVQGWTSRLTHMSAAEVAEVRLHLIDNARHPRELERMTLAAFAADCAAPLSLQAAE